MSTENIKKFYDELKTNKGMMEEMQNFLKAEKAETAEQCKAAIVEFASRNNLTFTLDELNAFEKETEQLSEEELDLVSAAGVCIITGGDGKKKCSFIGVW